MNQMILLALSFAAVFATALSDTILDFEGDDHQHKQEGEAGKSVEGSYSWTAPDGNTYYVKYIADENGYRVVESNVVPVSHDGVAADGNQGSFGNEEGDGGGEEGGEDGEGSEESG